MQQALDQQAQQALTQQLLASLGGSGLGPALGSQSNPQLQQPQLGAAAGGNDLANYHLQLAAQAQQMQQTFPVAASPPVAPMGTPLTNQFSYSEALSQQHQSVPSPPQQQQLKGNLLAALMQEEVKQSFAPPARTSEPMQGASFYSFTSPSYGAPATASMSSTSPPPVASVNVNINVGSMPVHQMSPVVPVIPVAPQVQQPRAPDLDDELNLEDLEAKYMEPEKPAASPERSPQQKTNVMVTRYDTNVRSVSRPRDAEKKSPKEKKRHDRSGSRGSPHKDKGRRRSQSRKNRKISRDRRRRSRSKDGKRDKHSRRSPSGDRRHKEKDRKDHKEKDRREKESSKDDRSRVDDRFSSSALRPGKSDDGPSSKPEKTSAESSRFATNPILAQFMEQQRKAQEEAQKQRDAEKALREKQEAFQKSREDQDPRVDEREAKAGRRSSGEDLDSLQERFAQLQRPPQEDRQKATAEKSRRQTVDRNASRSRSRKKSRSKSHRRRSRDKERRERDDDRRRDRDEGRRRDDRGREGGRDDDRRRERDRRSPERRPRADSRGRRERSRERRRSRDRSQDNRGMPRQETRADPPKTERPFRRSAFTDTPDGNFEQKPPTQPGSLSDLLGGGQGLPPPSQQMDMPPGQWQPQQQHLSQLSPPPPSPSPPPVNFAPPGQHPYAQFNATQPSTQFHSSHHNLQSQAPQFQFPPPPAQQPFAQASSSSMVPHMAAPQMAPPPPPQAPSQWGVDDRSQHQGAQKDDEIDRWSDDQNNWSSKYNYDKERDSNERDQWRQDNSRHSRDDREQWSSSSYKDWKSQEHQDYDRKRWSDQKDGDNDWYNNRREKWSDSHSDRGQHSSWQDEQDARNLMRPKSQAMPSTRDKEDDADRSEMDATPKAMPSKGLVHKGAGKKGTPPAPPPVPPPGSRRGNRSWDERDDDDFGDDNRGRDRRDRYQHSDWHQRSSDDAYDERRRDDDAQQGHVMRASSKVAPRPPGIPPPGLSPVPKASARGGGALVPQDALFKSRYSQDHEDSFEQPGLSRVPKAPPISPWRTGDQSATGPKPPSIPPPPHARKDGQDEEEEDDAGGDEKWNEDWEADDWDEDNEENEDAEQDAEEDQDYADQGDADADEAASVDEDTAPWNKEDQKKKVKITPLWKSQAVRIKQHPHHLRADPRDYSMCDLCHKDGTAFHCARGCDYDICISCFDKFGSEVPPGDEEEDDVEEAEEDEWWSRGRKGKGKKGKGKEKGKGKGKGKKKKKRHPRYLPKYIKKPGAYDDEHYEEPRETSSLALIPELAPKKYKWQTIVADENRRSFASFLPRALDREQCKTWFQKVKDGTDWKQPEGATGKVPRKTAWMVKRGCNCTYRYGSSEVEAQEYPPFMMELLKVVMPMCGAKAPKDYPDSCNMNLYEDGSHSVGWHADDEVLFQGKFQDIQIISMSFGQKRKFELRLNFPDDDARGKEEKSLWEVKLGDGDIMTMEGMLQKHYMHRVPKEDNIGDAPRINLTWRWVMKHNPKCPARRQRK